MKKISLLYTEEKAPQRMRRSSKTIYDLSLDRITELTSASKRERNYFLEVLTEVQEDTANATHRSEILKDFLNIPELLDGMTQIFRGYDNLPSETAETLAEIFRYGLPTSADAMLDAAYEELYINAHYARNVIAYLGELDRLLEKYPVKSKALTEMKELCKTLSGNESIREAEKAAEEFRNETADKYSFTFNAKLDKGMRLIKASLASVTDPKKAKKTGFPGFHKKKRNPKADIGNSASDCVQTALANAMSEASSLFSGIAGAIYEIFSKIGKELTFFRVASDLAKVLKEHGVNITFPELCGTEEDILKAEGLTDILLLTEGKNASDIVTNSIDVNRSALIRGENNCGKTSFLRAVGTAAFFAQSGLFVCAKSLSYSPRKSILTHFSAAEKEFGQNDEAGRFEGEVQEITEILDNIQPHSLVLLNETFQTTAYREGATGMKDILCILDRIKCRYLFVSHMKLLFEIMQNENVKQLTAVGYRLSE